MGNNQSSANHPHNRLTKPKTNTNSPSPPLATESPVSVSSRYIDLSAKGRLQIREALLSPISTDHGSMVLPNKEFDGVGELAPRNRGRTSNVPSRSNSRTNSRSNSLSCFGSRHGSTTKLTELHGSKISLVSNTHVDMEQAIRLLHDVKKNASPEDLAALHEALEHADGAAASSNEQGLSRRTSAANGSSSSLTRRRSLVQTPGVATRTSQVDGRRRTWNSWKAPALGPEEEAKWTPSPKNATANGRSKTLSLAIESRNTLTPRAQTPGEMDYSQLGSLKLGSLSIVNGAPSPAPSAKVSKHRSQVPAQDDYFSLAEDEPSPLMMKPARRRGHVKSKSAVLPPTAPFHRDSLEVNFDTTLTAIQGHSLGTKLQDKPNPYVRSAVVPVAQLDATEEDAKRLGRDANKIAREYQAAMPMSPFDQVFELEHPKENEPKVTGKTISLKEEAAQIFAGTMFDAPTTALETSGSSLFAAAPTLTTSDKPRNKASHRPPPRTADSGYSSGGSLRVPNHEQSEVPTMVETKPTSVSVTELRTADSHPRRESAQGPIVRQSAAATIPEAREQHIRPPPIVLPDRSARSSGSGSLLSPQTPRSITSRASFDSTSSANQRRLQRRRPSQAELPVVQSCRSIPEGNIPDVPDNVRSKFTRRLSNTPGMECLTHTYPSKDHIGLDESTTGTMLPPPLSTIAPFAELEPEQGPIPPPHGRRKSLSLFRRKSTVVSKDADVANENASFGVVDLGTIASSLGSSPYDAAMSDKRRKTITSPTHPHQLGGTLPRAKSMVGMGSEAAAEFARMHSRDRALGDPEMPQRRRKSHHNLKADIGEATASKRRPQSSHHDVPPMPVLDTSRFSVPHSAKPRLESTQQAKPSELSFGARSRSKGHVVSQSVSRYDAHDLAIAQQDLNWDAHARSWNQRRKSVGEGLRANAGFTEATASTINSRNSVRPADSSAGWGRYSGGLSYNYERGVGVGGSAGTRQLHSSASQKSMHWKNQYGVDLSDVPIMLQRAA